MVRKMHVWGWTIVLMLLGAILLSGCQAVQTPVPTQITEPLGDEIESLPQLTIQGVTVADGESIVFWGQADAASGICLYSQLYAGGVPLDWWPSGKCFPVESPEWQLSVPLGVEGAPVSLDETTNYELHIWWPGAPEETNHTFSFDLASPPES